LFGERLKLDILNMLYDISEDLVNTAKESDEGLESLKLNLLGTLAFDLVMSKDEFDKMEAGKLTEFIYHHVLDHYDSKNKAIAAKALPVIKDVFKNRGATMENILVPFTDGTKQIGVVANLKKSVETNNRELITAMEKMITLAIIDQQWKEHLRDMDDLKQSVQNAVYEQKDPLLIYKFEGFEAFKRFIGRVNSETISFLTKADIPVAQPESVQEAHAQKRQRYSEQKDESRSLLSGGNGASQETRQREEVKVMPAKSEKIAGRNDKVTVQYPDGRVLKDVKFKKVEDDINNGRCIVVSG
jgi:preprotein translocase subunit SecA